MRYNFFDIYFLFFILNYTINYLDHQIKVAGKESPLVKSGIHNQVTVKDQISIVIDQLDSNNNNNIQTIEILMIIVNVIQVIEEIEIQVKMKIIGDPSLQEITVIEETLVRALSHQTILDHQQIILVKLIVHVTREVLSHLATINFNVNHHQVVIEIA